MTSKVPESDISDVDVLKKIKQNSKKSNDVQVVIVHLTLYVEKFAIICLHIVVYKIQYTCDVSMR